MLALYDREAHNFVRAGAQQGYLCAVEHKQFIQHKNRAPGGRATAI